MLQLTTRSLTRGALDTLIVPVCEGLPIHTDPDLLECIAKATVLEEFSGEKGQEISLYDIAGTAIHRCVFIGTGPGDDLTLEDLRVFGAKAARAAHKAKCRHPVIAVPDPQSLARPPADVVKAVAEGAFLADHAFEAYKKKPKHTVFKGIGLKTSAANARLCRPLLAEVETICRGTLTARDWINIPSNDKPPETLARLFSEAAQTVGLKVTLWHQAQLQRRKFGALLAVAAGSHQPPCMVEMTHAPRQARKTIVLVGKGVTFDTGGISLKSAAHMDAMKADMSGAACVAATMTALAKLNPRHRIIGLTPLVENMPSGKATRPGDIVTSYHGKTVEIGNTDAEGRLILIDAMAYAVKKYKPDILIDLATLTGACLVALGDKIAGVFTKDDDLARAILDAAEATHERCWRLPLPPDYVDLLKSDAADINNMPRSRYGGAITAALFLSEFVGDTRWAHLDIAGPAFSKKAGDYCGPGGAGFGVRLLCELIKKL